MLKLRAVALVLALTIGACHNGPTAIDRERAGASILGARVRVSKVSDGIQIENLTDKGMGYFLLDERVIPVIDWAPCRTTTPDCLRLPAHSAVTVKFADIVAFSTSTKSVAAYTWWVVDNGNGGVSADLDTPAILKLD
jgi:hypothetical protein